MRRLLNIFSMAGEWLPRMNSLCIYWICPKFSMFDFVIILPISSPFSRYLQQNSGETLSLLAFSCRSSDFRQFLGVNFCKTLDFTGVYRSITRFRIGFLRVTCGWNTWAAIPVLQKPGRCKIPPIYSVYILCVTMDIHYI